MRNRQISVTVLLGIQITILFWSSMKTVEARSINAMPHHNFRNTLRKGLISRQDAHSEMRQFVPSTTVYNTSSRNSSLSGFKDNEANHQQFSLPFQDYLTAVIKKELNQKRSEFHIQSHSRIRRSKVKFIIKKVFIKIMLFIKLLAKEFVWVSKKAAIAAG